MKGGLEGEGLEGEGKLCRIVQMEASPMNLFERVEVVGGGHDLCVEGEG